MIPILRAALFLLVFEVAPAWAAPAADDYGVYDLPSAQPARAVAIIYSGDGGWQDLDKTIGEWLAAKDIHVIGISTVKQFWETREPEQVAADIKSMLSDADPSGTLPVMLIGYSFGANILPFAWPKLDPAIQARTPLIALLAPERDTAFHVSVAGWLGLDTGSSSVTDAMQALPGARTLCVYGDDEADTSGCTAVAVPHMTVLAKPGGHHFDEDYVTLGRQILDAFDFRRTSGALAAGE